MSQSSTVKPEVTFVDDMLNDIEKGMLKVPAFQRQYVWKHEQVLELFDSIIQGYPIGSVLLWESDVKMQVFDVFDAAGKNPGGEQSFYIVDGQQRLTTLYHCFTGNKGENGIWDVHYDLNTGKFLHLGKDEPPQPHYFSVKKVRSTADFLHECKRLMEAGSTGLIEKAETLVNTLRKYKLSIIKMVGGDIEEAIEIFTRLNRTGLGIMPFDIISALNYADGRPSPFSEIKNKMMDIAKKDGFFAAEKDPKLFGSQIYLRIVRVSSKFELYGAKDILKLAKYCKSADFAAQTDDMLKALGETLIFIRDELRFYRYSDLPYINMFYFIYKYFYTRIKTDLDIDLKKLKHHFYHSAISGLPSATRSTMEPVLDFFGSDFDHSKLPNQLLKQLNTDNIMGSYESSIKKGHFNATSAYTKLTFNIISHKYLNASIDDIDGGYLCYPPKNICNDKNLKKRLGNKTFFVKGYSEGENCIYSNVECKNNDERVKNREQDILALVKDFIAAL